MSEGVAARPRITMVLEEDGESFGLYLNDAGRDLLVKELRRLDRQWDHLHAAPEEMGEVAMASRPYEPGQRVLQWGKISFRPDDWDREYYPHVLDDEA